jgi:hypothetical protein
MLQARRIRMALDPRKRQKKLERKKAKEKKRALIERDSRDPVARFERTAAAPILDCAVFGDIWKGGMGTVLFSRELANGGVAFSIFLLDIYCLGVKDLFFGVTSRYDYDFRILSKYAANHAAEELRPECIRKLVEGAVAYARELGFPPHSDFDKARLIFGDIDASACPRRFDYGKAGRPYFIAGPHDSAVRCERIIAVLSSRLGPRGFDFMVPATQAMSESHLGRFLEEGDEAWED